MNKFEIIVRIDMFYKYLLILEWLGMLKYVILLFYNFLVDFL